MVDAALRLEAIVRQFRQGEAVLEVLRGAELILARGEAIALVGPSGAGKSTLLQIAGLLEHPDGGEVHLDGRWIAAESVYDKPLYDGLLRNGLVTSEQIPSIDWDGTSDCITQSQGFWTRKDLGTVARVEINPLLQGASLLGPYWLVNRRLDSIRKD